MTRSERIREALTRDIIAGARLPGSALDEARLAEAFGVSRTPVREALRMLASSGLVAFRPHSGAEVARLSAEQMDDLFRLMTDLEALCAGYCAMQMPPAARHHLEVHHRAMAELVRDGDVQSYADANDRFHNLIYHGAGNDYLAELTLATRQRVRPYRRAQFETLGRLAASHREHGLIVQAIAQGDQSGARQAMSQHLLGVRDALAGLPQLTAEAARQTRPTKI